uniref:non-classical arabinogalactan protein 30-like n=1 Tax=Erigeron canadensis TaxID=72917 RepID=UPI001CB8FB46|nr:non-classical arabinogalactan protein 30-like [Erigeron canadensis]
MGSKQVFLPLLVLICCMIINNVLGHVAFTQPPHHAPLYPPVAAPAPHHKGGHHKGPGGHHHKPPTVAPVHPPVKAPVKAPVHPPVKAPVKAPVYPPVKAPVHPPVKAPVHPPTVAPAHPPAPLPTRKQVAVRGMVYCKACKYRGVDTLVAATPLPGAVVLLTCNNSKYPLRVNGTTDKNGFFFIMPPKTLTTFGVHRCKVTLLKSSKPTCNHPTNLHYGVKGATLIPTPKPSGSVLPVPKLPFDVYTVGPFAYEPSKKIPCKL